MTDDAQLLRRFAEERSEPAFAELVRRHVGWVFHAALRRTGGRSDLAQDVAQYVFTALAKSAASLSRRESLAGWLYTTARFAASRSLRAEMRRRKHETAAHAMSEIENASDENASWEQFRPALDDVLDRLPERERETLLLRFFEGMNFAEVGSALGLSEDGARKRVDRALDKLRLLLARRGITSTATALGTMLATQAGAAVTAEAQTLVTSAALSGAALPGSTMLGVLHFMNATKAALAGAGALVLASMVMLTSAVIAGREVRAAHAAEASLADATREIAEARTRVDVSPRAATGAPVAVTSRASAAVPVAVPERRDPRADGRAFLDAFGGTAREKYRARASIEASSRYALFFRTAGLPEEKLRELVARTVKQWEATLEVTPNSVRPGVDDLSVEDVKAVLGESGFQQWQDFFVRAAVAEDWVLNVTNAVNRGPEPLTLDQMAELNWIVRENSTEYRDGGNVNERTVDWEKTLTQARGAMTDTQWQNAQTFVAMRQAVHALEALESAGNQAATRDAKQP